MSAAVSVKSEFAVPALPTKNLNVHLICKRCKDPNPDLAERFAEGDLVCRTCGLVVGDRIIDTRSEWRTFANSEDGGDDPSRVGAAGDPLLGGSSHLETTIIGGRNATSATSRDLNRVHNKTFGKTEKNLVQAFKNIQSMAERMSLSKLVVDSAKQLYKKVDDEKLLKGKTPEAISAACIYIACRENNVTRSFKEVCGATNVAKKEIGRIFKVLSNSVLQKQSEEISLTSYIGRFASTLDLDQTIQRTTNTVCDRATARGTLAGKSPISIVAACLYFAANMSHKTVSSKQIAEVAGCTEATLKNAYKLLWDNRKDFAEGVNMPKGIESLPEP
ncbi:transcription initiation factor IIB [Rhizophlyctis rosea]|uniref:Transcription initiation factor IIB n=1 Tax=Rhizophlyctis rosea TaxID=64517 RepID=A0AAD5S839_9FUNG|nr:transcription initiation factor IIB [Rhizophlyctis rosea]